MKQRFRGLVLRLRKNWSQEPSVEPDLRVSASFHAPKVPWMLSLPKTAEEHRGGQTPEAGLPSTRGGPLRACPEQCH